MNNSNPFSKIAIPVPGKKQQDQKPLSTQASKALYSQPSTVSPGGLRDLAILRMLANGLTVRQVFRLDLSHINEEHGILTVACRSGKQQVVILEAADQRILSRWLVVRRLFANGTDAVFISLHWTSGRAQPGQRLSERGIRLVVDGHLRAIGAKSENLSCATISKSSPHQPIHPKGNLQ